ncbi:MAG: TetR family transcriptional regulator [Actinomycetota bacterium]|nr:TetR family transcriptional regulator [Actinomycetota bacterium]
MSRSPSRGRRPGGPDTRGQILDAARESFAEQGFARTTIRGIATQAGVDPALVHHYFGTKDDLFIAALEIRVDPREIVPSVFEHGVDGAAERLLRTFLSIWDDPEVRLPMVALVRTSMAHEPANSLLHDGMLRLIFTPLRQVLPHDAERRAQLVATQMVGLVICRYVLCLEPLASMSADEVTGWVAPNIQRYFDGVMPPSS